jgi:guanylate kinase
VLPPSLKELKLRLKLRGDAPSEIVRRLELATKKILPDYDKYDYLVINDNLDACVQKILHIIKAERLKNKNISNAGAFIKTNFLQEQDIY